MTTLPCADCETASGGVCEPHADLMRRVRYTAANMLLPKVRYDAAGTPDRKLPCCHRCEEDELIGNQLGVTCLRCAWVWRKS
jgi:hypothetical protein